MVKLDSLLRVASIFFAIPTAATLTPVLPKRFAALSNSRGRNMELNEIDTGYRLDLLV